MLTILGRERSGYCDGVTRRDFLKLGGLCMGGLSLPQLLQAEAKAGIKGSHKAVIMVFLAGGPPHMDMFDLKPDAPAGIRGEYKPIPTNVPGLDICEYMPRLARMMDKFVVIRSLVGAAGDHSAGQCLTGYQDRIAKAQGGRPSLGSVVSRLQGAVPTRHPAIRRALASNRAHAVVRSRRFGVPRAGSCSVHALPYRSRRRGGRQSQTT